MDLSGLDEFYARSQLSRPALKPNVGSILEWSNSASYRMIGQAKSIRSILVIKLDHIGDFLLALDAVLSLREAFPEVPIDFACGPWNVELATSSGLFDSIYPIPFFASRSDGIQPTFDLKMVEALREKKWDLAIDLRLDRDTRIILRHIQARFKVGFDSPDHNDILTLRLPGFTQSEDCGSNVAMHQTFRMLRLVHTTIGVLNPASAVKDLICNRLAVVPDIDLSGAVGRHLVVCNTSCGRELKNWPLDRFSSLIRWLAVDLDCFVVLVGDRAQERDAQELVATIGSSNIASVVGNTTIREAMGLVAKASLYIGNDTGLTHCAARLGVPVIGLLSGVAPTNLFAPLGTNATVLTYPVPCAPCHLLSAKECVGVRSTERRFEAIVCYPNSWSLGRGTTCSRGTAGPDRSKRGARPA